MCKLVCYCTKECQVAHWKTGGHKAECKKSAAAQAAATPSSPASPAIPPEWIAALAAEVMEKGFAIRDGVSALSGADPVACRAEAESRRGDMKAATISTGTANEAVASKRSDRVSFLKPADELAADCPSLARHAAWVDALRVGLEGAAPLGMEKSTLMLAEYPGGGSHYIKHRDAAPSPYAGRKLTALYYLNPAWEPAHGGRLHIWPRSNDGTELDPKGSGAEEGGSRAGISAAPAAAAGTLPSEIDAAVTEATGNVAKAADAVAEAVEEAGEMVAVDPVMDRLVVFRSSLEHEVRPAFASRMALTAWFVNRRHLALELLCEQLSLNQDRLVAREAGRNK